ncbi:Biofilm growth-associated repressor [Pelotomaculum sp. FP]|nr:Biofilm growth-associated repressor [Pelotomaculum sp. FP]
MILKEMEPYIEKAELLKALAHPTRLCIVHGLLESECNVNYIISCLELPQSTVSQQLGILRSKGIIEGRRKGTEVCYKVTNELAREIVRFLFFDQKQEEDS